MSPLARSSGSLLVMTSSGAPTWFSAALADEGQERRITVEGTQVAYREWGDPADRNIVLVHGGAAHSRWWDHIAPLLASGWRVGAMGPSRHGDSGPRERYSLDVWAREVLAVVADAGTAASTVVIGHSMGGLVTLRLGAPAGGQTARGGGLGSALA